MEGRTFLLLVIILQLLFLISVNLVLLDEAAKVSRALDKLSQSSHTIAEGVANLTVPVRSVVEHLSRVFSQRRLPPLKSLYT